ncbi:MAG TPA: PAS domain S-box protein, partial [Herpetosiphonaceae bacterium]
AAGDPAALAELAAAQGRIDAGFEELAAAGERHGAALNTAERAAYLATVWAQLRRDQQALALIDSSARYGSLLTVLDDLLRHVGDQSRLVLDPELETEYLIRSLLQSLPEGQDLIAEMLLEAERLVAGRSGGRARLGELITLLRANNQATAALRTAHPGLEAAVAPLVERMTETGSAFWLSAGALAPGNPASLADYRAKGAAALAARFEAWDSLALETESRLLRRIALLDRQQLVIGGLAAAALLAALYVLIGFYRSVMQTVAQLETAAQRLVSGDSGMVSISSRDELREVAISFNRIATAMLDANAERAAIVENAADAILTIDEAGRVQSLNAAAEKLFGLPAADLAGRPATRIVPGYVRPEPGAPFSHALLACRRGDGVSFPAEVALSGVRLRGRPFAVAMIRDRSEQQRAEAEREELHRQVVDAQAEAIKRLATPLIPVTERTVAMPLVGSIDAQRAEQIVVALLGGVEELRAEAAIIDITGVAVADEQVARMVLRAAAALELLGARTVVTGIRPEAAAALVALGLDLGRLETMRSLQDGIAAALRRERRR